MMKSKFSEAQVAFALPVRGCALAAADRDGHG